MPADRSPSIVSPGPVCSWSGGAGRWTLTLRGDLRGDLRGGRLAWPAQPEGLAAGDEAVVDAARLEAWDAVLAADLWDLARTLRRRGVRMDLRGLPSGLGELLELARAGSEAGAAVAADQGPETEADQGVPLAAERRDAPAVQPQARGAARRSEAAVTVAFFGEVLLALGRWLRGGSMLRFSDVLEQLDRTGPRSLPIVLLTCALVGLMLAYMGGAQLGRIGAQGFLADVVTVGMVRELAGLMTGVILAGRVGAAFASQLAAMQAGEEIDALRVLGVDPVEYLVLPRLLALVLMAPALVAFGALAGIVAGWPAAVLAYGVSTAEYLHQSLRALTFTHLWIGLFKGVIYVALVAVAGCRCGLHAGRSAQAVGEAATAAVVRALVWIVTAACGTTVVLTSLGF
jgi:phospholipid/cholesterol/gamma-HCH transport system permease protein